MADNSTNDDALIDELKTNIKKIDDLMDVLIKEKTQKLAAATGQAPAPAPAGQAPAPAPAGQAPAPAPAGQPPVGEQQPVGPPSVPTGQQTEKEAKKALQKKVSRNALNFTRELANKNNNPFGRMLANNYLNNFEGKDGNVDWTKGANATLKIAENPFVKRLLQNEINSHKPQPRKGGSKRRRKSKRKTKRKSSKHKIETKKHTKGRRHKIQQ